MQYTINNKPVSTKATIGRKSLNINTKKIWVLQ